MATLAEVLKNALSLEVHDRAALTERLLSIRELLKERGKFKLTEPERRRRD